MTYFDIDVVDAINQVYGSGAPIDFIKPSSKILIECEYKLLFRQEISLSFFHSM